LRADHLAAVFNQPIAVAGFLGEDYMIGPGKYDDLVTDIVKEVGIDQHGGGVVLIIVGGNKGNGFSCQCDLGTLITLPELLQEVVNQMKADTGQTHD
jgi:hypothetical protein